MDYKDKKNKRLENKIEFYKEIQRDLLGSIDDMSVDEPYTIKVLSPDCDNNKFNYERGFFTSAQIYYKEVLIAIISPNISPFDAKFEPYKKKFNVRIHGVISELREQVIYLLSKKWNGLSNDEEDELYDFFCDIDFDTIQECIDKVIQIQNRIKLELNRFFDPKAEFKKNEPNKYVKCYDKFGEEFFEGDEVDVQQAGVHKIFKKEDGQLYFSPYGKDEMVSSYFSNDLIRVIK